MSRRGRSGDHGRSGASSANGRGALSRRLSPARWLLRLALPGDERDAIVNELDEVQAAKFPARGFRAWAWYWRQAVSFSVYFIAERYHESSRDQAIDRTRENTASRDPGPQLAPPDLRNRKDHNMRGFLSDIAVAVRQLVKQPAFTAVVVLTLALGIGPNTAIFSVVNSVLLQPLPYENPHELSLMRIDLSGLVAHPGLAEAEVVDFRTRAELLADVGAVTREYTASLTAEGNMEAVLAADVSPNLFSLLGVSPQIGRHFTEDEGQFGVDDEGNRQFPPQVAILSHGLWQRRYAGDPDVMNQTIEINNRQVPIAGVMREGFQLLLGPGTSLSPNVDLWQPLVLDPQDRGFWAYRTIARLAPDATFEQAGAEVAAIGAQFVEEFPDAYEGSGIMSIPDEVFEQADQLARRMGTSRSALYARALVEFVARHDTDQVTDQMNRTLDDAGIAGDEFPAAAAQRTLQKTEW